MQFMKKVTMKALKYNNILHYESTLNLVQRGDKLIILHGPSGRTLKHHTRKKEFVFDKQSLELYFKDRWYTVACVFNMEGIIEYYYCNIAMPCTFLGDEVSFVDLDLDVIIQPDMSYEVIDRDEFEEHKSKYGYPPDLVDKAETALNTIISHIEERKFPFNGYVKEAIAKLGS